MESGNCEVDFFFDDLNDTIGWGYEYSKSVGCPGTGPEVVECLRKLSTRDILDGGKSLARLSAKAYPPFTPKLAPIFPWAASIDKSTQGLEDAPLRILQSGKLPPISVIVGTNENEGDIFLPAFYFVIPGVSVPLTEKTFMVSLRYFFNETTSQTVKNLYEGAATWEDASSAVIRDFFFACPARRVARSLTATNSTAYLYHYAYVSSWWDSILLGDYHSSELEYVFDNPWPPLVHEFDRKDRYVASAFGEYWYNFGKTYNPNSPASSYPQWPPWNPRTLPTAQINYPTTMDTDYLAKVCKFWDTVYDEYVPLGN